MPSVAHGALYPAGYAIGFHRHGDATHAALADTDRALCGRDLTTFCDPRYDRVDVLCRSCRRALDARGLSKDPNP